MTWWSNTLVTRIVVFDAGQGLHLQLLGRLPKVALLQALLAGGLVESGSLHPAHPFSWDCQL